MTAEVRAAGRRRLLAFGPTCLARNWASLLFGRLPRDFLAGHALRTWPPLRGASRCFLAAVADVPFRRGVGGRGRQQRACEGGEEQREQD